MLANRSPAMGFTSLAHLMDLPWLPEALRVMEVLPKRFERYGLKLHPTKTRLIRFQKPNDRDKSSGEPESFDLLGFSHYWSRSLRGNWVVKRKTSDSRLSRALRTINQWCSENLHEPLAEQQQTLGRKIRGHCAYYGITGNSKSLSAFRLWVVRTWRRWLSRRNRERGMTWDRFNKLLESYPLPVRWRSIRLAVMQPIHEMRNRMR